MTAITNTKIAAYLGLRLVGAEAIVSTVSAFPNQTPDSISFLADPVATTEPATAQGGTVVTVEGNIPVLTAAGYSVISAKAPKYALAQAARALLLPPLPIGIHFTAHIGPQATIADDVFIGPGAVLDGLVSIGPGSRIGANTILKNTVCIGAQVTIRCGTVIGEDAYSFGFSDHPENKGDSVRFPSFGGVCIENDVEIGNNCVIARGLFNDTVIRRRAKINDLAHIGNSVEIGEGAMIMAQTDISGRVIIGAGCWIGQSAAIRQGVVVGSRAQVGMGAVVTQNVESGTVVYGVPARARRLR